MPHDSADTTSLTLIEQVQAQDADGWRRLVRVYGPLIYDWCRNLGLQADDARDVVQEVFRAVARSVGEFRRENESDSFRGWLWTITRNKVRDFHRRRANRPSAFGGSDAYEQLQQLPDELSAAIDSSSNFRSEERLIHRVLDSIRVEFEETTWNAFWRATVDGQTSSEIAADLGTTPGAVRQCKYRVLRRLRQGLES